MVEAFVSQGPSMIKSRISCSLGYEYLGEQSLKNIFDPVRVYRVGMESKDGASKEDSKVRKIY